MSNGNGSPPTGPGGYEEKFSDFIKMCREAKSQGIEVVIVHQPQALGDTYEELIESLSRLADAELGLNITSR